jgi:LmbE family N-acetylglucosaminyl deacetylase
MNILAIGGHFDDVEIGCGGAVAKHVAMGDKVTVLVLTHSEYSNYDGTIIRDKATALREGKAAAEILGYKLICGNINTKAVKFDNELVELINRVIDENKIQMVYTHWDFDVHQDHQAIGKATLAAARKINNLLMYRSNLYLNTQKFTDNYYVDITKFIDLKIEAIKAHENELNKFGEGWLEFWINEARNNGQRFGVEYAEAYQLIKLMA